MPNIPAKKGCSTPSRSMACAARNRTSACAAVTLRVCVTAGQCPCCVARRNHTARPGRSRRPRRRPADLQADARQGDARVATDPALDPAQQRADSEADELLAWLADGGQVDPPEPSHVDVIEAHDGQAL